MVEILITIVVLAILGTLAILALSGSRDNVLATKLNSDVRSLNTVISTYLAEGGDLTGVTSPQAIINKLKTVRTNSDANRQVSVMTGRGVDVRLEANMLPAADAYSTTEPRAVWNSTTQRFEIATSGQGVASFGLNSALQTQNFGTEARASTATQYNGSAGWVWAPNSAPSNVAYINPTEISITNPGTNTFDPTDPPSSTGGSSTSATSGSTTTTTSSTTSAATTASSTTSSSTTAATTTAASTTSASTTAGTATAGTATSGSTTSSSTTSSSTTASSTTSAATTAASTTASSTTSSSTTSGSTTSTPVAKSLPKPVISPVGATYTEATFPTAITITSNGAPGGSDSVLEYRLNNSGSWIPYTGPVTVASGTRLDARNRTLNSVLYKTSSSNTQYYYKLVANFAGTSVSDWTSVSGGPNLEYNVSPGDAGKSTLSHGDTKLILADGQVLDAGVENVLTYSPSVFGGISPNTEFSLGELIILNGTTFRESEATSATLKIVLNLTSPGTTTGMANLNFTMTSTDNSSDREASADYVTLTNPNNTYSIAVGGVTYRLNITLHSLDSSSGWVSGNSFYIYEGASARAELRGKFVN